MQHMWSQSGSAHCHYSTVASYLLPVSTVLVQFSHRQSPIRSKDIQVFAFQRSAEESLEAFEGGVSVYRATVAPLIAMGNGPEI